MTDPNSRICGLGALGAALRLHGRKLIAECCMEPITHSTSEGHDENTKDSSGDADTGKSPDKGWVVSNGLYLIIMWLTAYVLVLFPLVHRYGHFDRLVVYWTILMFLVASFEAMLIPNSNYMCEKGQEYSDNGTCFWSQPANVSDAFSSKLYMDLYADYSLADAKYRMNYGNEGFHFVLFGELWHGFWCVVLGIAVMYTFYAMPNTPAYFLSLFSMGLTQLVMIIWYVSPAILELFIEGSPNHVSNWWWPPFMWNVPWFIIPPMFMHKGAMGLLRPTIA